MGPFRLAPRAPTLHALCEEILGQQLSIASAAAIARRFNARFGEGESFDAGAVMAAREEELRACGLSAAKAASVKGLVAFWQGEGLSPERVRGMSDAALLECLTQVRGVGPWTVKMFLIFALRRPDVLPVEDLGLRAGLQCLHALPDPPKPKVADALAAAWAPWRSVGTWYCWQVLRLARESKAKGESRWEW